MTVNYAVKAEVIDISNDSPKAEDAFIVDTNVWYWMTYPHATAHIASKMIDYPEYLNEALSKKSKIYHSRLSLAELSHIIEKTEREIYCSAVCHISAKEYRHNKASERTRVVTEINSAWQQITSLAEPLNISINENSTIDFINRLTHEKIDGYDLFILESMKHQGVVKIITDDGDFCTVPGIQVFTLNRNIISAAKAQKKLLSR